MTNPGIDVPGGLPALHAALSKVARGLAGAHGQRQFYSLSQVQARVAAAGMDAALSPWAFAAFVTRDDFEAFFAVREGAGSYRELRAAMSPPEARAVSDLGDGEFDLRFDGDLALALRWLSEIASEL